MTWIRPVEYGDCARLDAEAAQATLARSHCSPVVPRETTASWPLAIGLYPESGEDAY